MSYPKNLKRIEFTEVRRDIYEIEKVSMFNSSVISAEEVDKYIKSGLVTIGYNPNVVIMTKEQYENLKDVEEK